ncbi:MAG: NADH:ubiquinone reductase (Na(+)-transporting) subunit C [Alistipes sp.]|nr:NADH:ubiquinone reductase (Na(+)-transporting) subunit C [Alistipes sp.]
MATKKFVCKACGHVHEGAAAPEVCPVCKAPRAEFAEQKAAGKQGWMHNTNSNTYIIIYSVVMVVIVATVLAVASLSLQKRQAENELREKKSNILQSLGYDPATGGTEFEAALNGFDTQMKSYVIDSEGAGSEVSASEAFSMIATNKDMRDNYDAGRLVLFQAADGRVGLPLVGMGLWGDIWGYVALANDFDTVSGIVMAHKGETPGLGAEIATPGFQQRFVGKKLFRDGEFVSIALRKGGAKEPEHEVDAITGGTKTSDGVTAMLRDCLKAYLPFFRAQSGAAVQPAALPEAFGEEAAQNEVSNLQNVNENHE